MVQLNDIKRALTKLLSTRFPDIHILTEDIVQAKLQKETIFPLLHLQLTPLGSELEMGACTRNKTILSDITYMERDRSPNATIYQMYEELETLLGSGIQVHDRYLHIDTINGTIADDLLHVTFQLEFNDGIPSEGEQFERFGELQITGG